MSQRGVEHDLSVGGGKRKEAKIQTDLSVTSSKPCGITKVLQWELGGEEFHKLSPKHSLTFMKREMNNNNLLNSRNKTILLTNLGTKFLTLSHCLQSPPPLQLHNSTSPGTQTFPGSP